jgi:uncharacterized protein YdhG (YjbR/CyaY superfamily)
MHILESSPAPIYLLFFEMLKKPKSIDEYLKGLGSEKRAALEKLRKSIKAAAPEPKSALAIAFPRGVLDGKLLVAFAAAANHCSFFPMSSTTIKDLKAELKPYETSKGTIRFSSDKPLPVSLFGKSSRQGSPRTKANTGVNEANYPNWLPQTYYHLNGGRP